MISSAAVYEYCEDGEIVDVHVPEVPANVAGQIGGLVQVRIAYASCDVDRVGRSRLQSITEHLQGDAFKTMRFVW